MDARTKSIDFDRVADFYDLYVDATYDLAFWEEVAAAARPPRLELMCGTGRIALSLLRAGHAVEGLDYAAGLLDVFRRKARSLGLAPTLHEADARDFRLAGQYGLAFIGFQSISEVVDDLDKACVFACVRRHLAPGGQFWVTIHNPVVRGVAYDGRVWALGHHRVPETGEEVAISGTYRMDGSTGVVTGVQRYRCTRDGRQTREIDLPMRFHAMEPERLVGLLEGDGWQIAARYGDYDRSPFVAERSPYFIVSCFVR